MKRWIRVLLLAAMAMAVAAYPAYAQDSKTDPVEIIDTTEPSPEPIEPPGDDGDGGSGPAAWSLVNLCCTLASIGFGAAATSAATTTKRRKSELLAGERKLTVVRKEKTDKAGGTETALVQKSKLWKSGFCDPIVSVLAVVVFLLTENLRMPMCLTDRWTPLMGAITGTSAAIYGLAAGGRKLSAEVAEKILAAGSKKK